MGLKGGGLSQPMKQLKSQSDGDTPLDFESTPSSKDSEREQTKNYQTHTPNSVSIELIKP